MNRELIKLIRRVPLHVIGGREPGRIGGRESEPGTTICLRLLLRDRKRIVRALKAYRRFNKYR